MKTYAIFVTLVAIGLFLLWQASGSPPTVPATVWLTQLASVVLIAGTFGIVDKALLNRDTFNRISKLFKIHESVEKTGLREIGSDANKFDYGPLIEASSTLSIVVNDGRTWVSDKITHLQVRLTKNVTTELFLTDPESPVLPKLAEKTGYSVQEQKDKISQAMKRLTEEFESSGKKGKLKIYYLKYYATHAVFIGDDEVVITLYGISSGRKPVPAFVFSLRETGALMHKHVKEDVEKLRKESVCVYDCGPIKSD
ncbi:MAG: hypothetical protein V1790_04985 [Planctomycetota bacterium]